MILWLMDKIQMLVFKLNEFRIKWTNWQLHMIFYEVIAMKCPNCSSKDIGKIGVNQYYCWNCFVELSIQKGIMHVHQVEEDGVLSSLDDLFSEEDRQMSL